MRLYVGNLSYETSEAELKELFAAYGEPASVRIITDNVSGRSKGFGFVELPDDAAREAMTALNGKEIRGRTITVNEARPRPERGGFGGGGGRGGGGREGGGGGYGRGGGGGYGGGEHSGPGGSRGGFGRGRGRF
jgi:RNA recognition motif-containing protein